MDRILIVLMMAMMPSSLFSQTLIPSNTALPLGRGTFLYQSSSGEVGPINLEKKLTDTLLSDAIVINNSTSVSNSSAGLVTLLPSYTHRVSIAQGSGVDSLIKYLKSNPGAYSSNILITGNPDSLFKAMVSSGMAPDGNKYIIINKYLLTRKIHGVKFGENTMVPVYNPLNRFDSTRVVIDSLIIGTH